MRHNNKQSGYVALLAVLVVGAASLAIATALLLAGTNSQRETLVQQQSAQARSQAVACAEEALQQIHDDTNYTGNGNLTLGASSCNYTVTNTGGSNRTITANSTVGTVVRKVQITLTIGASSITINTWQDTANGGGSIAHVQTKGIAYSGAAAANMQGTFDTNPTSGNTIVVAATWGSESQTMTCDDNRTNTYTTVRMETDTNNDQSLGVCYAPVTDPGATTVTVTFAEGLNPHPCCRKIVLSEYSGVASVGPVDVHDGQGGASGTTATDNITSTASSTTVDGDLIYGVVMDTSSNNTSGSNIAPGTNFTERHEQWGFAVEDRVQTTAASTAATFTFTNSSSYDAIMVAFKAN